MCNIRRIKAGVFYSSARDVTSGSEGRWPGTQTPVQSVTFEKH